MSNRENPVLALLLFFILPCMQSCDFYHGIDYVKDGTTQPELRKLMRKHASLELTDAETIKNAFTNGGRDPSFWFEVKFDTDRGHSIQQMLLQNGFGLQREIPDLLPRFTPEKIASWWDPSTMANAKLFTLQRNNTHRDSDGVWCFLDLDGGRMLVSSFTD